MNYNLINNYRGFCPKHDWVNTKIEYLESKYDKSSGRFSRRIAVKHFKKTVIIEFTRLFRKFL